jgi:alpha-mannosidase
MLPSTITFNDVHFRLAPAKTGTPDAVVPKGQMIKLPSGSFNRLYILAAAAHGDQMAKFDVGMKSIELNIEDWGGFIGQWDDRQWSSIDSEQDKYGEMTGLRPGYTKRADLAWYCSHHHNAGGENVAYSYAYLFAYGLDLPPGTKQVNLPDNGNIRILAMSVVQENPGVKPVQPLYDVLLPTASQTR